MERYLRRTPLGGLMDRLGLRLLAFMLSTVFFVLLWGARPLSFLAGAALGILLLLLIKEGEKKRLKSREKKLRSVLGGELTLEKLLLAAPKKAHFETVMILSSAYQMTLLRTLDEGVLCEIKGENVLIALLQKHPSERCGAQDVLAFQRTVRAYKAIRGVLCLDEETGEIMQLYIAPAFQSKGIGGVLLSFALYRLRPLGRAFLTVLETNARARGFYEKHGFLATGERTLLNEKTSLYEMTMACEIPVEGQK